MVNWYKLGRQVATAAGILHTGFGITNKASYTYRNFARKRYRSRGPRYIYGLGTGNFNYRPRQYSQFISSKRGFRIRQRRGHTRRRYRPRRAYRPRGRDNRILYPGQYQTRGHTYYRYHNRPGTVGFNEGNIAARGGRYYQRYHQGSYWTGQPGHFRPKYHTDTRDPNTGSYWRPRSWIPSNRKLHLGAVKYRRYATQSRVYHHHSDPFA